MAPVKNYTPEQMGKAIEAVAKGEKIAAAAEKFGVPRVTLYNKISGKSPKVCSMGPKTYLSENEENVLVNWILLMSSKHLPITKDELLDSVQKIIADKGQTTPFAYGRPGKKWYSLFLKRHPVIAERTAQNLTTARDNVSEQDIRNWFSEIDKYLEEKGLKSVLEDPERVFNTDESAFYLSPKPGKVLAGKGEKHVYSSSGDEKDNLTVLVTGNAAGQLAPTMVVYSYERIPGPILTKFPDDFGIGRSPTGWMCGSTFYEYMTNVFHPWIIQKNIKKPILFFLDGHKSHLTLHLSNFCVENQIEIISLNPNSTHILQPMDLAVFRPLKTAWRQAVAGWKLAHNGQNLKKEDFAPLLKTALQKITGDSIKNGFRAGGLFPFGPSYVDMSKIKNRRNSLDQTSKRHFLDTLEHEIKAKLRPEKMQLFKELYYKPRNVLEDSLPMEDVSLYVIWASIKDSVEATLDSTNEASVNLLETEESNVFERFAIIPKDVATKEPELEPVLETPHSITSTARESMPAVAETYSNEDFPYLIKEPELDPTLMSHLHQNSTTCTANKPTQAVAGADTTEFSPSQIKKPNVSSHEESLVLTETTENSRTSLNNVHIALHKTPEKNDSMNQDTENDIAMVSIQNIMTPETSSSSAPNIIGGCIVPSPFKRNLFWPGEDDVIKGKKRRLKEKLPFAVTSQAWRKYHANKEEQKRIKTEEKERRAKEREQKKMLKMKIDENKARRKKLKSKVTYDDTSSDDTDTKIEYCESDDSPYDIEDDISTKETRNSEAKVDQQKVQYKKGIYVIVKYEGEYFPGQIENVSKDSYEISTMTFSTGSTYKWPEKPDKIWYQPKDIIEVIDTPVLTNKRGFYSIKEMQKFLSFTV